MKRMQTYEIAAIVICAMLCVISCNRGEDQEPVPVSNQTEDVTYAVNTYRTVPSNLDDYLEFGGDVSAVSSVDVLPDAAGKLLNIYVEVGDVVKKNQLLATVDPSKPGLYYEPSPVRAPVAGTVSSFPLSTGATVSQSTSIGKISSTSDVEITISVAERFVSRINLGQTATLTFDAYPGESFTAKVTEISPVLDTVTRTMTVKLRLDPKDSRVKIGMYARVKLVTETKENVIVVPSTAVIVRNEKPYVFIVQGGTASLCAVTLGLKIDNKQEITSGLNIGNEVIISGQTLLDDGSKVNVVSCI